MMYLLLLYLKKKKDKNERNCKEQNKEKEKKEEYIFFLGGRAPKTSQLKIYLYIRLIKFINNILHYKKNSDKITFVKGMFFFIPFFIFNSD